MIKRVSRTLVVPRYCWTRGTASTNLWLNSGSSDGFSSKRDPVNTAGLGHCGSTSAPSMLKGPGT